MASSKYPRYGFTIVELLIVVVVIALLAAISVVGYNGVQDRARRAKVDSDIRNIISAIQAAREVQARDLRLVTGSGYTASNCVAKSAGTDLSALPDSDNCIVAYNAALSAISNAGGVSIVGLRDPWGRPYKIDENEGEAGGCLKDSVGMYALPHNGGAYHTWTPNNNVPRAGFSGCATP